GCELDFSSATIDGEAALDVLAFWGGIGIKVPRGWQVVWRVTALLGGYEDKTTAAPAGAPRLIIRGTAIMGGIDVRPPAESETWAATACGSGCTRSPRSWPRRCWPLWCC